MQVSISPDTTLGFEVNGQGQPLVFLHAFPLDQTMWQNQIDEFSRDYTAVTLDVRGLGASSSFTEKPSIETIARDLNVLLDHLEIREPIALCGLSMGGYAAMEFARLFPERLGALILADTRPDADSPEARTGRAAMIELAKTKGSTAVVEKMLPKLLGKTTRRDKPEIVEFVREIASRQSSESVAACLEALRDRRDSTQVLQKLEVPTLVVTGAQDEISTPEVMGKMAASMPNARHVVIENAGHLVNLEAPDIFNQAVREFLA